MVLDSFMLNRKYTEDEKDFLKRVTKALENFDDVLSVQFLQGNTYSIDRVVVIVKGNIK